MRVSSDELNMKALFSLPIIVAALGNLVDVYDLLLFSIVRVSSLKSLGLDGKDLFEQGMLVLKMQMMGMLFGGILWGVLGDKKGRVKVLYGSILLFSIATIASGFVASVPQYAFFRFVAGIGLAGELGAGVALVSEILPKGSRGYGAMMIASVGFIGAILANIISEHLDWRNAYFIGGGFGFILLFMRAGVLESSLFRQIETADGNRGDFLSLFTNRLRFYRYMRSILIGIPLWFLVGIILTLSPEFAIAMNISGTVSVGKAVMFGYMGAITGDFASSLISQRLKSRKKTVYLFLAIMTIFLGIFFSLNHANQETYYAVCWALGFSTGFWVMLIVIVAEQFGTNLRATVATTVPNFARGSIVPITLLFQFAKSQFGILNGGALVGILCVCLSLYSVYSLEETFSKDLNYLEV